MNINELAQEKLDEFLKSERYSRIKSDVDYAVTVAFLKAVGVGMDFIIEQNKEAKK